MTRMRRIEARLPRMIEGGLDAVFFAAFVAQGIRDDDGHTRARELALQMLDAVWASAEKILTLLALP